MCIFLSQDIGMVPSHFFIFNLVKNQLFILLVRCELQK